MARPKDPLLRARVLAAAAHEFASRGFAGTSIASIGEAAGVTKGGVYFHFSSKEALFFAVLDAWMEGLRSLGPVGLPAAQALPAFVAAFLEHHFANADAARLLRVLATEMRGRLTAELRADHGHTLRGVRARVRELLGEGIREGSLFASDPAQAAFLIVAAIEGIVQQWLAAPGDVEAFCDSQGLSAAIVKPWTTSPRRGRGAQFPPVGGGDLAPPF